MNHNELDKFLRILNPKEMNYKNETLTPSYLDFQTTTINNQEVYIFDNHHKLDRDVIITKQNRFISVPLHIHTFIEMNYVYSGKCTQIIDGHKVDITEGQLCIIDTHVPHSIMATSKNDIIINIMIKKEFFSASFLSRLSNQGIISDFIIEAISDEQMHNRYIIFHSESNDNLSLLVKQLLCEYYEPSLCTKEIINCYMVLIFSELIQVFHYDTNKVKNQNSNIIAILNYIENSDLTLSLKTVASHFNYNPNYLSSLIKNETGKTFKTIIQDKKLAHAAYLLSNSNLPIYQIALDTNYNNLSFFYKKFSEKYGVTPQNYRDIQNQKATQRLPKNSQN